MTKRKPIENWIIVSTQMKTICPGFNSTIDCLHICFCQLTHTHTHRIFSASRSMIAKSNIGSNSTPINCTLHITTGINIIAFIFAFAIIVQLCVIESSSAILLKNPYNAIGDPELIQAGYKIVFYARQIQWKINATASTTTIYYCIDLQPDVFSPEKKTQKQSNQFYFIIIFYDFCCCFCLFHTECVRAYQKRSTIILLCTLVAGLALVFA